MPATQNDQYVDLTVCGVLVPRMKVMTSQYKGKCSQTGEWFDPGTVIAFKHKDYLTPQQKAAIYGTGTVYHVMVICDQPPVCETNNISLVNNPVIDQTREASGEWTPSVYQGTILDRVLNSMKHVFIEALAGCGKTQTLVWIVKQLQKRGLTRGLNICYLAFNKSIQQELVKKLMGTGCPAMTTHAFCFAALKKAFRELEQAGDKAVFKGKTKLLFEEILADDLGFDYSDSSFKKVRKSEQYKCRASVLSLVGFIKNWAIIPEWTGEVYQFTNTQKERIEGFLDEYEITVPEGFTDEQLVGYACRVTSRSIPSPGEQLRQISYDDMLYLPLALNLNLPKYDLVLTDESQDFNEAQELILFKLVADKGRAVVVGDENQCVIEGTRIMTAAGEKLVQDMAADSHLLAACGGSRTKSSQVSEVMRRHVHNVPVVTVETKSGRKVITTMDHTHFAGYKEGEHDMCFVYLMYRADLGFRVGFTKNYRLRLNQERADAVWILDAQESESQSRYLEQFYSIKYGIPTWVFYTENRGIDVSYDDRLIKTLFEEVDTRHNAIRLLGDKGMSVDHPHHRPTCVSAKRPRNFGITMCGDGRTGTGLHRYSIGGSDQADAEKLRMLGLKVRPAKDGWRVESAHAELSDIYGILYKVSAVMDIHVVEKARFGKVTLPFTRACNVRAGMTVFVADDQGDVLEDEVSKVTYSNYTGNVYDLNVNRYHNYIANGVVTHNCIYRFRGADTDAFKRINEVLSKTPRSCEVCDLPINYRSDEAIIEHCRQWVPKLMGRGAALGQQKGEVRFDVTYGQGLQYVNNDGTEEFAFLCRINVPLVITAYQLISQGKKVCIIGRQAIASPMLSIIEDLCGKPDRWGKLPDGGTNRISDRKDGDGDVIEQGLMSRLAGYFRTQSKKLEQEKHEGALEDLTNNCDCIEIIAGRVNEDSVEAVRNEIESLFTEASDDRTVIKLSTVHRAKGLEFDTVLILRPELMPHPNAKPNEDGSWSKDQQQEQNIQYVAGTRARHKLWYVCNWPFGRGKSTRLSTGANVGTEPGSPVGVKAINKPTLNAESKVKEDRYPSPKPVQPIAVNPLPVPKGPGKVAPTFTDDGKPF